MEGSTISATLNVTLIGSVTSTAIIGAGKTGVRFSGNAAQTSTTAIQVKFNVASS